MKTIKLGQQYLSPFNNLFVFAKIGRDSYGFVCIQGDGYFKKHSFSSNELNKDQCEKIFECLYNTGKLLPQNITVYEYFNQIPVEEIPVGSKFIENEVTYTRISDIGLEYGKSEFVWAINQSHVVVKFDKNLDVTKTA